MTCVQSQTEQSKSKESQRNQILEKNGHPAVEPKMLSMAQEKFEELSKEELIRRVMMSEMERINVKGPDLNPEMPRNERRSTKRRPQGNFRRRGGGRNRSQRDRDRGGSRGGYKKKKRY